jgi:serine protease Do
MLCARSSLRWSPRYAARRRSVLLLGPLLVLAAGLPCGAARGDMEADRLAASRAAAAVLQDAFVRVADELEPAVVTVHAKKTVKPKPRGSEKEGENVFEDLGSGSRRGHRAQGTGSGVLFSADGWIITNDHVVAGSDRVTVKLRDGRELDGEVRRDYRSDIALVKVNGTDLPFARLGDSDKVRIGQWAIAIGTPYKYEGSLSVGVISSLGRKQEIRDSSGEGEGRLYSDMIQTDAAINPGNSGGPLVNLDGEVVAINTAIESENGASVGIGFAIPINTVKFVADQLRTQGKVSYGYLGIEPETLTPRLAESYKAQTGAIVRAEPSDGSPASKAGVHVDDVVTAIDGKPIRSESEFRTTVSRIAPGTTVEIQLVRAGEPRTVKATLVEPPAPKIALGGRARDGVPRLGVEVAALTADHANRVGLLGLTGVVVRNLDTTTSAAETELQSGDVVLTVNGVPTPTVESFKKATSSLHAGEVVRIIFQGKRYSETVKRVVIFTLD